MVGSPDFVQKNVMLENNSLSAEQITGVENRKSKAGEAVLPVLRSVSLFLLGLLGVLLILLTLLVIAAEAARIICLGPAAKKQQKERPGRRIRRTEARIYQYLCLWGIDAGLGWETAATDAELARRFPAVEPGEYTRVCHLIEKHIYGEILLSPYEERTLNHFLEKLMEPVPGCNWKMRLKLRYACLRRVNTKKKKKRKHSAFQQKIRVRKTNEKRDFTMKFVTFNIRCDFGQDGANNFIYRRPLILEKIRQEKPDIIGFQEVLPHVAAWLKENLTEYYIAGCGRERI